MSNATLVVNNNKGFVEDIWQCESEFTRNQWKEVIDGFADILSRIYDILEDEDIAERAFEQYDFTDSELYELGDTINMLKNIDVAIKHKKGELK